jgi:hypothetical protein
VRGSARDLKGWLVQLGLVRPLAAAVRPVGRRAAKITVSPHRTVAVIAWHFGALTGMWWWLTPRR